MNPQRLLLAALVALQPIALGGCVAAVVPVLAGGMVAKSRMDGKPDRAPKGKVQVVNDASGPAKAPSAREKKRNERLARQRERDAAKQSSAPTAPRQSRQSQSRQAQSRQAQSRQAQSRQAQSRQAKPATPPGEPLPERVRAIADSDLPAELRTPGTSAPRQLAGLTALPTPGSATGAAGAPLPDFVRFALAAAQPRPGQPFRSALVDPATLTTQPTRPSCGTQPPAVVIDLDPGKTTFDLDDPPAAAPGLAEQLATLRAAGITILWQTSLPVARSERLYATLAATGLDPDRTDRLLLQRKAGERKQARRQAAASDWCILAVAGDSKGDFEEAFDYLRDPAGPIASALAVYLGDGWFLIPQPIH